MSTGDQPIMTKDFHGFPHDFRANSRITNQISHQPGPACVLEQVDLFSCLEPNEVRPARSLITITTKLSRAPEFLSASLNKNEMIVLT